MAAGHTSPLAVAPPTWLRAHDVAQWAGPRSLPLWVDDADALGIGALSNARATEAGLRLRPLADTFADIVSWARAEAVPTVTGAGLTDGEERELLAALGS